MKKTVQDLNDPKVLRELGIPVPIDKTKQWPADAKDEKDLQNQAESWLSIRGYRRSTADNAERGGYVRGYFLHLHKAKRNPLMADLTVISGQHCVQVELKCGPIQYEKGQEAMIASGRWQLATTLEEFKFTITAWEESQ